MTSFVASPAVASLPYAGAFPPAAAYGYPFASGYPYAGFATPSFATPALASGPTVVPVSGSITAAAPTTSLAPYPGGCSTASTLTALPGGYYGANTVSMTYLTTPIADPHIVAKNPIPANINVYKATKDSHGAKNRAQRATVYGGPAVVPPVLFGCYKPVLKDPKTGAPVWFRTTTLPAGAMGSFLQED